MYFPYSREALISESAVATKGCHLEMLYLEFLKITKERFKPGKRECHKTDIQLGGSIAF